MPHLRALCTSNQRLALLTDLKHCWGLDIIPLFLQERIDGPAGQRELLAVARWSNAGKPAPLHTNQMKLILSYRRLAIVLLFSSALASFGGDFVLADSHGCWCCKEMSTQHQKGTM